MWKTYSIPVNEIYLFVKLTKLPTIYCHWVFCVFLIWVHAKAYGPCLSTGQTVICICDTDMWYCDTVINMWYWYVICDTVIHMWYWYVILWSICDTDMWYCDSYVILIWYYDICDNVIHMYGIVSILNCHIQAVINMWYWYFYVFTTWAEALCVGGVVHSGAG